MHLCDSAQVSDKSKILPKPESMAVNNSFLSAVMHYCNIKTRTVSQARSHDRILVITNNHPQAKSRNVTRVRLRWKVESEEKVKFFLCLPLQKRFLDSAKDSATPIFVYLCHM